MSKIFSLLVMCFIMTLSLHAAAFSNPQDGARASASNMASTYVPIESWVYPAFEQLAAEGYLSAAFFSLRPWTRMDCARLEKQTEWWRFPLLSTTTQHNAVFIFQLSYRPVGRVRQ